MKTKYIILTCILIVICVELAIDYIPFLSPKQFSRDQFNNFNQMFVHHRIVSIEGGSKSISIFTLKDIGYKFKLYLLDPKSRKLLFEIANSGDSLYKPAYSDTIYIYRTDSLIKVCFNKKK